MQRRQPFSQWPVKSFGVLLIAVASIVLASPGNEKQPDGEAVLARMANYLAKLPAWSVTVHTSYDAVQSDGFKVEWNDIRTLTLKRPDRLRVESKRSDGVRSLVLFDGKTITSFDESARVYAQERHPGTVDDAVVYFVRDLGMRLPMALMLRDTFPAELQQRLEAVKYVERTETLGAPADHIAVKTATVDAQVWIAEGERPLPLRVVLTYKNSRSQPQFRAQFSDWNTDIKPEDDLFAFTPPAGVNRIPFAATLASIAPAPRRSAAGMKGGKQ
jgi:hypothetical protein